DQWQILRAIIDPFLTITPIRNNKLRSIFIVGDHKQSIYSFQGAAPENFQQQYDAINRMCQENDLPIHRIPLQRSYRAAPNLLGIIDDIFTAQAGEDFHNMQHSSNFPERQGLCEIWPLLGEKKKTKEEKEDDAGFLDFNPKGITYKEAQIDRVVAHIDELLQTRAPLQCKGGQAVTAGDILILLRYRSQTQEQLHLALKRRNIPVASSDRLTFGDNAAILDIMSVVRFCANDRDDLALAEILRGPFIGCSQSDLERWCVHPKRTQGPHIARKSLWEILQMTPSLATGWLEQILRDSKGYGLDEFLARLLTSRAPACGQASGWQALVARLGHESIEPVQEFLDYTATLPAHIRNNLVLFCDDFANNHHTQTLFVEENQGVRIMTIHSAKGLQAPIVYLLFENHEGNKPSDWYDCASSHGRIPFYFGEKSLANLNLLAKAKNRSDEAQREEGTRLLYVAMTRAAEQTGPSACQPRTSSTGLAGSSTK
ncbi:MAG: 3'-5' exonuclease, partial [Pseudomonadota bacterium]